MERYQKLSGNGRKCIYVSRHTAQGIRVTVFTDGLQTGGSDKMGQYTEEGNFFLQGYRHFNNIPPLEFPYVHPLTFNVMNMKY